MRNTKIANGVSMAGAVFLALAASSLSATAQERALRACDVGFFITGDSLQCSTAAVPVSYRMNGHYLTFQEDGNLCVYRLADRGWVWCINNDPSVDYASVTSVTLEATGQLVARNAGGNVVWQAPERPIHTEGRVGISEYGVLQIFSMNDELVWQSR